MATTLYVGSGEEYKTLQAAVDAAGNGDTIVLKENVSETSVTIDGKELSIDLGNFTFTGHTYIKNNAAVSISNGKMTVEGTSPAFNAAVITVLNNEVGNDSSSLSLDGVIVDGGEAVNSRYYTHAVTYNAIGGLTVKNSTLTAGTATRNAECGSIGSNSSTAIGIYASNKSGGAIVIENSTINGGYGKTDAEWTGYVSQLFSPGGYAISLHGATDVTITDSAVNGGGSNWYNAAMAINVSNQFEGTLEIEKSEITGGNAEGAVGNYGSGGVAIYTHMATSCEKISVSGSTITGGAGGKSSNGSGIEYRNSNVEMSITDSTIAAGDGEKASGNGAAIAIYNASETQLVLDEVQLNGDGNGSNTVIKGGAAGVTLAGPVEIIGGELTNTTIIVDAENLEGSEMIISGNVGDGNDFSISGNDKAGIVVENGKTYVTTETDPDEADTSTLYCNSAWAGKSENELVGIGKFYGVNAFDSFRNAIAAADSNSSVARIEIESDITETTTEETFDITQHLTIGAASAVKVTLNGANLNIYQRGHNSSVTIEENVTISGAGIVANGFATSGNDLVIDGTLEAYTLKQWTSNGTITVSKTGKVALGFGDGQFDMAYGNGVVNVTGSLADTKDESLVDGPQFRAGYSGTRGTGNILNLTDTYFEAGRDFSLEGTDGTINASNSVLKISGGDSQGILLMEKSGNAVNLNEGSRLIVVNVTIGENNKLNVVDSSVEVENITNNGTFTVAGESTLNIAAMPDGSIDLLDGAIVKDSTVAGSAFVAGNVTFRGDNSFGMIYDYGVLTDYYGTTAPMKWTVEAGASLTLTDKVRYGLGYGDEVLVEGNIAEGGAAAARATLNDDDASNDVKSSLFMHGLVAQESKGWDCSSSFTVKNAFVTIGSNNSFGSKPGNFGGNYTFNFENSVLNSSRITFYDSLAKTVFTLKGSDVEVGQFMTRDQDSVFTLDNTVLLSTSTVNGNDEGQYNAGTLNVTNGSVLTYSSKMTNEAGLLNIDGAKFVAPEVVNNGTFTVAGTEASVLMIDSFSGNAIEILSGGLTDSDVKGANIFVKGDAEFSGSNAFTGNIKAANGAELVISGTLVGKSVLIGAGNDSGYYGIPNADTAAGSVVVSGDVTIQQANANASGSFTVAEGGKLTTQIICVENGDIEDAEAGVFTVAGDLDTQRVNVFNGGTLVVTGFVSSEQAYTSAAMESVVTLWNGGTLNIEGGTLSAGQTEHTLGRHSTMNVGEGSTVNVKGGTLNFGGTLTNEGAINVTGESTLDIAAVSGNGWIYMDNATLNADTRIQGGKVRFTNGTSTLSGAVLNTSAFQVGIGAYEAVDGRENVENVVVNVNDNSYIHAVDADYYGWVGTGWFENDADKAAGMTDARYTLNINNSVAEFGYFHVSTDGILNVTGNADEKKSYTGVSYSYYGGRTMINGVATFDNVDALVQYTNVSCDNGTDAPGKLVIKNGANYVSWLDHSGTIASFQISKTGIVEVDNATLDARHGTLIAEDASLTVKNNGTFKGKAVTNNGTITVDGAQFTAASLTNQGTILMDEGSTISFETLVNTGTINITIDAANLTEGVYSLIDMTGDNALAFTGINVTIGAETKALEQLLSNGSYVINDDYAMLQTGNDLAIYKVAQDVIYVDAAYAGLDAGTIVDGRIVGINAFADTKAALSAANSSGGADIVLENVANDDQESEFTLTEAGTYTVTGGNGAVFTPLLVNGADITLKFDKAFITLGKLRGGKDSAGYTKSSIEVTDSVIASNSYAGYGGGWATFYDCAVTINNSIYGINLNKYADALELPRSAADVKAAVSEDKYAYASGSGYDGQHIGTVGSLDIDGSTVFTGFFSVADRGYADIDNSVIYICGGLGIGDGMIQNGNDSNNSGWSSPSAEDFRVGSAAAMDIDNSIVRNITLNGEGGGLQVGSDSKAGVLNIKGSEFDFTAKGESSDVAVIYGNGTVNVADSVFKVGTLTNKGTFNAEDSTLVFGTFTQDSATGAIFNNVDLTADSFVNGDGNSDNYVVVGGTSKLNIANLSGYFALRLADGVVLKGGTSVDGSTSLRSLGDATFGEKADDKLYICSYDNNNCGGITLTVNGTLDISEEGKGYPTYWFGITGDQSGTDDAKTLLTGAGTVNVNTSAIFQFGTIVIDEELTINVTDVYAGNLNLTKADVTLKGKLIGTGSRNKLSAFNEANLTVTGENAAFALDSYLLVGYATYKGDNDTTNEYKSIVNVEDGAKFAVAGDIYVNLESQINIKDSSFTAGSNIHNLGVITVGGTSTVVIKNLNGDINFAEEGAVLTDDSSIWVSGNINAAGDLSFFWNGLSASGSMSVAGTLAIDGVQLDEATTVIYSGAVSFGSQSSLVINGSKVLDNTIVVDGKMYDVAAGENGINVTVREEVEVSEVTFTVNSITQAEGTYAFTFDITAQGGNTGDEYIYSVTAFDMNGNEIAGTFKDMVFTFADPAESNWVKFNVTVSDAYGESTATSEITNKEVADCTAPWFEADVTASAVKDENGLYNVMDISFNAADNFAVVGYIITVNGEEFTLLGTEHKYSYKTDVTGSCTYTVAAFDAAGNKVTSAEQSVDLYAGMKEDAKGISRIDGTGFAVDAVVSNGFGAYTYEIISVVEGETALKYESDGLNFTLADVPVKGELTVTVKVTDEKQNEYTFEVSGAVTDDEAPVITVDAFSTDWTNENVTITASASDNYGAVTFEYKIDDGEWITYVDGVVVDHNKAVVTFKATDAYGNVTEKEITVENIDKDVPTLTISGNPAEWTNKEVTLTASSNEADGVIEYFNGTEWVAGSTLKVSENGTYKFRVTDKGGNTVESEVVVDKIDMVQPALEVSGGSADWSNKEVILTVTTGEDASGIKSVEYSVNGGEFSAVADGKIEFNENGEYKVVVKVTDNAGNVTTSEEQTVLIDKTAPAVEISGGSEDWSNKEVVLNVTTGEDASGIKSVEYSVNGGEFSAVADGKIEFNENGEYKVVVKVTDNAGNETISEEQTVLIDKTAPVIAVSGNASAWTSENVTLDVTVEDITSTRIEYQIGEGEWLVSEDGKIVVDANAAVNVKVTDAAGNVSEETILVDKIDKLDPTLEIEVAPTDEMTNGNVTVIVKASDDVSGIASLRYSFNGTEWSDYTGDITVEENTVIYFETTDNAGKITKKEINVSNIDKVAPDAPAASADKTELTNETVTVTATFGDAVIKEYSFNGTDWFAYTDGVRMTENGTVYFRGIDAAGNVSETSEFTVSNIDAAADNADTVFVYINAAYSSDKKLGAVNGVQLVYGENAFASVEDAQKALNDLENVRFVMVESKTTIDSSDDLSRVEGITGAAAATTTKGDTYKSSITSKGTVSISGADASETDVHNFKNVSLNMDAVVDSIDGGKASTTKVDKGTSGSYKFADAATGKISVVNATVNEIINYSSIEIDMDAKVGTVINESVTTSDSFKVSGDKRTVTLSTAAKAAGTLTIGGKSTVVDSVEGVATVKISDSKVGEVVRSVKSQACGTAKQTFKVSGKSATLEESFTADRSGKFTIASVNSKAVVGAVSGYNTVTINGAETGSITNDLLAKRTAKYQQTGDNFGTGYEINFDVETAVLLSKLEEYSASGSVTLTGTSAAGDVTGYNKVTAKGEGSIGKIAALTGSDIVAGSVKVQTTADVAKGTVTTTETIGSAASVNLEGYTAEAVAGYKSVTLTNAAVTGDVNFGEAAKKVTDAKGDTAITYTRNGSLKAAGSRIGGSILNYNTVTLDGSTVAGDITNTLAAKSTISAAGVMKAENKLSGSVTLKADAVVEGTIANYSSVTLSDADVEAVKNVAKITVKAGVNEISSFTGTEGKDSFTVSKGAVLTLNAADFGAGSDTLNVAGTLVLTGTEILNLESITGKGEIAAAADIFDAVKELVGKEFKGTLVNLGATAEGYRGLAAETADNSEKKAAKWDGEEDLAGWLGNGDSVDYIKFSADEGATLTIAGLADDCISFVGGNVEFANGAASLAAGEYILKLEHKGDDSVSYSIALS